MNASINEEVVVKHVGPRPKEAPQVYLVSAHVRDFLNVRRLQGRLTVRQTAALLNCGEHDIPVLISRGLISPLGHPPPSAQKYFSPVEVLQMAGDSEKMGQICDALYKYWKDKNAAKSNGARGGDSSSIGRTKWQNQKLTRTPDIG